MIKTQVAGGGGGCFEVYLREETSRTLCRVYWKTQDCPPPKAPLNYQNVSANRDQFLRGPA